jgi:hypothetical protein
MPWTLTEHGIHQFGEGSVRRLAARPRSGRATRATERRARAARSRWRPPDAIRQRASARTRSARDGPGIPRRLPPRLQSKRRSKSGGLPDATRHDGNAQSKVGPPKYSAPNKSNANNLAFMPSRSDNLPRTDRPERGARASQFCSASRFHCALEPSLCIAGERWLTGDLGIILRSRGSRWWPDRPDRSTDPVDANLPRNSTVDRRDP